MKQSTKGIDTIITVVDEIRKMVERAVIPPKPNKIGTLMGIDVYSDEKLKDGEWYICMKTDTLEKITKPYIRFHY